VLGGLPIDAMLQFRRGDLRRGACDDLAAAVLDRDGEEIVVGFSHEIRIVTNGAVIGGWTGYTVHSSMLSPADDWELRRPFDLSAWNIIRRDADVQIEIDGTPIVRGIVDKRRKDAREGTMTIAGRDRAGRLVDESAPSINYSGMTILQAFERLARPWFGKVTLSDARNRHLRVGKGKRVSGGNEPSVLINVKVPRRGIVHPGEKRSQVMHEIAARAGLIWWSSADGQEIFVGKPNQEQPAQYVFLHGKRGSSSTSTVKDLIVEEDDGDRYSVIVCAGVGGATPDDFGKNTTDRRGRVFDNPLNKIDGTGRDFIHRKEMFMPERDYDSYSDAQRVARNEQIRRDYKRHVVTVEAALHGQFLTAGGPPTLFAFNTVARVIDEELELDDTYLIVDCSYTSGREQGEATTMHMVPTGTEILL
jgi:prophage tail gpP-like protein